MSSRQSLYRWLREPLLHFVVLAGLLFLLEYWISEQQKPEIVISRQTVDYLVKQREELELRPLSAQEREAVIEQFIEDEILYAESYRRGLDRGDSRMRRNLILKMRGLLAGEVGEPGEEQLRAWYDDNRDRFTSPDYWSIEQVFFSNPADVPPGLTASLDAGLDPATVGESNFNMRRVMLNSRQQDLVGIFGASGTRAILAAEKGHWTGPVETDYGQHFVRVTGHRPSQSQPFEQVERYLGGEWMLEQTRARVEAEVESLRDDYRIRVEAQTTGNGQ